VQRNPQNENADGSKSRHHLRVSRKKKGNAVWGGTSKGRSSVPPPTCEKRGVEERGDEGAKWRDNNQTRWDAWKRRDLVSFVKNTGANDRKMSISRLTILGGEQCTAYSLNFQKTKWAEVWTNPLAKKLRSHATIYRICFQRLAHTASRAILRGSSALCKGTGTRGQEAVGKIIKCHEIWLLRAEREFLMSSARYRST